MKSIDEILDFAIYVESNGYEFYTEIAKKFKEIKTVKIFHTLAESNFHNEQLLKKIRRGEHSFHPSDGLLSHYRIFTRDFLKTYTFSDNAETKAKIKSLSSIPDAIRMAVNFEKDKVVLFASIRKHIDKKNKARMIKIIDMALFNIGELLSLLNK